MNEVEKAYWDTYRATVDISDDTFVEASIAGNEEIADTLLQLYLDGKKTAGSGLVKDYVASNDPLPEVGNHWIVLDSGGTARCIVRTDRVEFHRFDEVPVEVAIAEGEGDLSLEYWRRVHRQFFEPFLVELGVENLDEAMVVTEFYTVVYRPESK